LLTEEIQLRIRETDFVARQIKKFLFDGFNGIIGVDSLGKKDYLYLFFPDRIKLIITKYCSEEGIILLLHEDVVDIYDLTLICSEFYIAVEYVYDIVFRGQR